MSPVSILVLLDVSLKAGRPVANRGTCRVSILVLLDVSLKEWVIVQTMERDQSFNPCSFGCQSERIGEEWIP